MVLFSLLDFSVFSSDLTSSSLIQLCLSISFSLVILSLSDSYNIWSLRASGFCFVFYWFSFTLSCLLLCLVTFDCVSEIVFEKLFVKIF